MCEGGERGFRPAQPRTDADDRHQSVGQRSEAREEAYGELGEGREAEAHLSARPARREGRSAVPAEGRRRRRSPMELPRRHGLRPDGGRARGGEPREDRKSTRLTPVTNAHLVCRLLLEKKKETATVQPPIRKKITVQT